MVSALWKAAADGDLNHTNDLLKDASHVDIEVKDHTGVTPLIQAVRNGHVEIVKELLARGADPNNASSQGKPESYTQDPAILELLKAGGSQPAINGQLPHTGTPGAPEGHSPDAVHHYDQNGAPPAPYPQPMPGYWYMPPGGAYPPYPYMPHPPAEGMPPQQHPMQGYYPGPPHHPQGHPPQPSQDAQSPQDAGHQQPGGSPTMHIPPEVARTIPCRYFPMCKYGASCMFAHPAAPYYNGPPPPVSYPGYEAMNHPPSYAPHGYYGVPPPPPPQAFPPPPAAHATGGPQSPVQHTGGAPPPHPVPFPADGSVPPPPPPGAYPYPPPQLATSQPMPPPVTISPTAPYHPAPVVIPVQPPVSAYTSPVSPTLHRKESGGANNYPQPPSSAPPVVAQAPQTNGFVESPVNGKPAPHFNGAGESEGRPHFQSNNGYRRGGFRKTSFNGPARPPCLFFPAGKCKNGAECRFPHVRPEDDPAAFGPEGYPPPSFPQRNGRPQNHMRGGHGPRSFGPREHQDAPNGEANGQPRPHMTNGFRKHYPGSDFAPRGGFHNGGFRGGKFGGGPGHHHAPTVQKEKVLSQADFPSLNGATTPPTTNGHVNGTGLTAAQVLKRNAPQTPAIKEVVHEEALADAMAKVTINGHAKENGIKAPSRPESPDLPAPVFPSINDTVTSAKLVAAA
jgi:hypothetical protein